MMQTTSFRSDGLRLAGELYTPPGTGHPGLIICHGIPARPYDPEDRGYALLAEKFADEGFAVLFFYFRGAGPSEGNFDMVGWTHDLTQAVSEMEQFPMVDAGRLFVMGFSGGAATALYIAARDTRIQGVVSCASPADFHDLLSAGNLDEHLAEWRRIGIVRDPAFPPDRGKWERGFEAVSPINCIADISPRPVLLQHGDDDEVVPVSHACRLFGAAKEPKQMDIIGGGLHRLRVNEEAMEKAGTWLKCQSSS